MTIQITIIGLGQIGASLGLALAARKETIERVGHDREPGFAKQALKLGAVDRVEYNLPRAVEKADVVLLTMPHDQVRETLEIIAADLKEGCVVLDTAPVKGAVALSAGQLIPEGRHYVGLVPVINPKYLHETAAGLEAAACGPVPRWLDGDRNAARRGIRSSQAGSRPDRVGGCDPYVL